VYQKQRRNEMKVIKMLSVLASASSTLNKMLDLVMDNHRNEDEIDDGEKQTTTEYLGVAYACDIVRDMFNALPDELKAKADEDQAAAFEIYPHKFKVGDDHDLLDIRAMRRQAHVIHMWTHEQYDIATSAINLYTK